MNRGTFWRRLFRIGRRVTRDVNDEVSFHISERIEDLVSHGSSRDDARAQALREFGDVETVSTQLKQIDKRIADREKRADWRDAFAQDVRYALRGIARAPGFTVMVTVTLALGLGANAAIFSVLERIMWRQPPGVAQPHNVKRIYQHYSSRGKPGVRSAFSYPEIAAMGAQLPASQHVSGYRMDKAPLGREEGARQIETTGITDDYFGILGVQPALGRFFSADEARAETFETVAIISHSLWMSAYGGSSSAIGANLDLGSHRYTVIGVAPPAFTGIDINAADVWVPMSTRGSWKRRNAQWYTNKNYTAIRVFTRIDSPAQVLATEVATQRGLHEISFMTDTTATAFLAPVVEAGWPDAGAARITTATRLAGAAVIILLISCANVVNLLLARAMIRRREVAIRIALGVSRARLAGQFLTESVMQALIAGSVAVFIGALGAAALRNGLFPGVHWGASTLDLRIAAFTAALALLVGAIVGVAPALRATNPNIVETLKAGAREGVHQRSRLRDGLIIAQAALSVVLLAGAGLFVRSLQGITTADVGYDRDQVLFASVGFDPEGDSHSADIARRLPELAAQVARLPNVDAVGLTAIAPFNGFSWTDVYLPAGDSLPKGSAGEHGPYTSYVDSGFFRAAGIRVLKGRGFTDADREGAQYVIAVNKAMAHVVWPNGDAIGKCLVLDEKNTPCRTVVGVVSDAHLTAIVEDPAMQIYIPIEQWKNSPAYAIVIRTPPGRTHDVMPAVRSAARATFGDWAKPSLVTVADELAPQIRPWRFAALIFGAAGLLALLVAAVGIYSTVAYTMSQRTHEMGVRIALGAQMNDIVKLVITSGAKSVVIGIVAGIGAAIAMGKVLESLLYKTSARDPMVLAAVGVTLLVVTVIACLVPALRAGRTDPVNVLRDA